MENVSGQFEDELAKAKAKKTGEEIRAFAEEDGIDLSDEMIEGVSGGVTFWEASQMITCPSCGSSDVKDIIWNGKYGIYRKCNSCGFKNYPQRIKDLPNYEGH